MKFIIIYMKSIVCVLKGQIQSIDIEMVSLKKKSKNELNDGLCA